MEQKVTIKDCLQVRLIAGSIMSGLSIGLGGTAYLACSNKIFGAFLFCMGLFTICVFGFDLFTGKCGYLADESPKHMYLLKITIIWIGNFIGTAIFGYAIRSMRPDIVETASTVWSAKMDQELFGTIFLGMCCGALMYIAVDNFRKNTSEISKYLGIFLCVMGFIFSGYEHSIADMYYMHVAGEFNLVYLLIVTVGNVLGSIIIPLYRKIK